jgi:hypothetical protein
VLERARRTRRDARRAREAAENLRELVLVNRWSLWAAGALPAVPDYVPRSWCLAAQDDARVLDAAASACEDVAVAARLCQLDGRNADVRQTLVLVAALCEVTAGRIRAEEDDLDIPLSGCARLFAQLDDEDGFVPDPVLLVATRTAIECVRIALARLSGAERR